MATRSKSSRLGEAKEFFAKMLKAAFPDAVAEYKFHPTRRWRLDWFLPSVNVGIEIEGGIWIRGRHTRPVGFLRDIEKYNAVALMGIKLYRINHQDLKSAKAIMAHIERIKDCLRKDVT
jgi:hypothetical protein